MEKKIRKKTTTRHNFVYSEEDKNWVEGNHYVTATQEFDINGNLTSQRSFNRDGEPGENNEYSYDEKGRVKEELIYYEDNELAETHRYVYADDGKVLEEQIEYQGGAKDTVTYSYNSSGKLLERKQIDEEGEIESLDKYEYDGELITQESIYNGDNELITDAKHTYDAKGNIVETIALSKERGEKIRTVYEYDEQGRRDCIEHYNGNGQVFARTTYTFDESGNMTEMLEEDTVATKTTKFENDAEGRVTLQEEFNEKEELNHRIERTYDENGELIESVVYVDRHDQGPDQYYATRVSIEYSE
jgi:antitoxin component YwqK of YwqJK toxin-antitoxin module